MAKGYTKGVTMGCSNRFDLYDDEEPKVKTKMVIVKLQDDEFHLVKTLIQAEYDSLKFFSDEIKEVYKRILDKFSIEE